MAITYRILLPASFSTYFENIFLLANNPAAATGGVVDLPHIIPDSEMSAGQYCKSAEVCQDRRDEIYPLMFGKVVVTTKKTILTIRPDSKRLKTAH